MRRVSELFTKCEEHKWRQWSRVKWLKEVDRNYRYFHILSNLRRKFNRIGDTCIGNSRFIGPNHIKEGIFGYFKNHFQQSCHVNLELPSLDINRLSASDSLALERKFSAEEVWEAICDCDGNKAPGPDDFNLNIIKANWEVVRVDFLGFMEEFYNDGSVVKHMIRTFIALVPKIKNLVHLKEFRPISLVGSVYKVLAKVLTNRLKKVMGRIISP
ncbi:hypothetical protein Ddye_013726 [Dipteronia dyeriana]|uniref:Reverse transcriptase domain-containing protein n=1 Tax=Dipteronia dyeriana TaxID=168575 RepID=A0AAD9X6V1_9ROSI|nr:hypothetical protein Ddye_013726 [Dipteronia dyeriana]